jgi:formylglycine-generating enzyme required for sulfatase activity
MKLRLIPPGRFTMGSGVEEVARVRAAMATRNLPAEIADEAQNSGAPHLVVISGPYYMSITEVTRGQFAAFVRATGYRTEAERDELGGQGWRDNQWVHRAEFVWNADLGFEQSEQHPVVNVTWNDAVAFCRWLTESEGAEYRLPTEAEWEFACRAGTVGHWAIPEPREAVLADFARFGRPAGPGGFSAAVASARANPFGLHDMHGNVFELCLDRIGAGGYPEWRSNVSAVVDPRGLASGDLRVLRGGAFGQDAYRAGSAHRVSWPSSGRSWNISRGRARSSCSSSFSFTRSATRWRARC